MAHFSRLQITLHWLTLLLTGIAYAAIELRGWAPKGSSVYLFMKDMHYDMGVLVWALIFLRLYLKHKYPAPAITPPLPRWQQVAATLVHIALYLTYLTAAGRRDDGVKREKLELFWYYCTGIFDFR